MGSPERSEGRPLGLGLGAERASTSKKQGVIPNGVRDPLCHFVAEIRGAPSLRFGVIATWNEVVGRPLS